MEIFILSSGRARRQATWDNLPLPIQERTKIVVPYAERNDYAAYPILTHQDIIMDVAKTRQWLVDHFDGKVLMMDDDLTFATRSTANPTKFIAATPQEIEHVFENLEDLLDRYVHVGMSGREGANRNVARFMHTTRMMRVLGYDTEALKAHKVRFSDVKLMEDFHVSLSLLRKGFDNCVINYMVQNQYGSNTAGGCSQYRTDSLQEMAAFMLKEHHPAFVKVVKKQTKGAWGSKERTDVVVQWKRALGSDV